MMVEKRRGDEMRFDGIGKDRTRREEGREMRIKKREVNSIELN
jgi:hypothetical protein